jgi:hypothetical protein
MKIATHVLLFGQDKWIMRNIENAYPHVNRIYVAHSTLPWSYNPSARNIYRDTFDMLTITNSKFADKITIIEGIWNNEEDQRNACVDAAKADGMEILLIHDADEFYFHNEFKILVDEISFHMDIDYFTIPWVCFWKNFKYCLLSSDGQEVVGYPEFAINLTKGTRFERKRRPNSTNSYQLLGGVCYHGSFVLTDEEVLRKIETWGHANDFDRNSWYNRIWLNWTPEMTNLHLVSPSAWSRAVEFKGQLPEVINDLK